MKIQGEKYEVMRQAIQAVIAHRGLESLRQHFQGQSDERIVWVVWQQASDDLRYDDSHPRFRQRARVVPHNPQFDVYSDGCSDVHIEAALKKTCREAGLTT